MTSKANGSASNYSLSSSYTWDTADFSSPSFTTSNSGSALTGGTNGTSPTTIYDQGMVTMTVGTGFSATASYSQSGNSTAAQVASALATALSVSGSPVTASASGGSINLTYTSVGPAGDVAVNVTSQSTQTQWAFSPPSFSGSGTTLAGGYNPEGASLDFNYFVTQYAYDGLGDLLTVTQKGDPTVTASSQWRVRNFTYDTLGRLLTAQNPESGTTSYSYDADNNLSAKTDARGMTTDYSYDALNRLTMKLYPDGSARSFYYDVTPPFQYNAPNHGSSIGRLTHASNNTTAAYDPTYDAMGRIIGIRYCILSDCNYDLNATATYDLAGDLTQLTYPDGETVTYTPDSAGRMLSVLDSGNGINYATSATYGPDSSLTGFVSGKSSSFAGITNAFTYNKRLQPINMSAASLTATVFSINYDFHLGNGTSGSDNGNVWGIINNKDITRNQTFTYDPLNRLASAQNAGTDCTQNTVNGNTKFWGNSYGYDAFGNLLQKAVTKCSAENLSVTALTNNQLAGYSYDAAGNMTSDPTDGATLTYDAESQMASAIKNSVTTTYSYDADGNRARKVVPGSLTTEYIYFNGHIIAEKNALTGAWTNYVFFNGERVARRDTGNTVSYYFSDHLKTTDVVADAVGNIKSESDFYPWGGELQFVANDSNHYKFTGKERDTETGLDYFGSRYYGSALSRFVAADPIYFQTSMLTDPQRLNLYAYVRNNPTRFVDPKGEAIELTGSEEERKKALAAARSAVGPQAAGYLYENKVETKDASGNKTTRYFIGVLTNGPDGKGPAFGTINPFTADFGRAIAAADVLRARVVPAGTTVTAYNGDQSRVGPITLGESPGWSYYGKDGYLHMDILDPSTDPGKLPGNMMSDGQPGSIDLGLLFGHEVGHHLSSMGLIVPSSDHDAVDMENKVRKARDPNAPTRRSEY